jgi:glycosyltransferase involved in cell wall biosynthesis
MTKITFATFFPLCKNIHLTKDVGMIPYILYRDYGYDSYLISYKNDNYSYLKTEVPGLKIIFIKHTNLPFKKLISHFPILQTVIDTFPLIIKYGRRLNVFELYYYCKQSIIIATIYKLVNKKGCVFLKLDYVQGPKENQENPKSLKVKIKNYLLNRFLRLIFDIISVETLSSYEYIKAYRPRLKFLLERLYYIPNGVDVDISSSMNKFYNKFYLNKKENIILHIGRIGSYQKATEIVLEAFSKVAREFTNWRLVLIGIMDKNFIDRYNKFLCNNTDIRERISFLGFLNDREKVYEYYYKSKILAFPSRWETFSMVPIEAGFFGDVLLASNIPCIKESTDNGKLGYLCPIDDVECFSNTLRYMLSNDDEIKIKSKAFRSFIINNYNWNKICGYLNDIILKTLGSK